MEIYQLRSLTMVARTGSITRAAERLAVSQPALSAHIKALETEFGVTLFERSIKGMIPTAAGRRLIAHAERVLEARERLFDEARRIKGQLSGALDVGVSTGLAPLRADRVLALMAERHPMVTIRLIPGGSQRIVEDIANGMLHAGYIATRPDPTPDPALDGIDLASFAIGAVAASCWQSRLGGGTPDDQARAALATLPWVMPEPQTACRHVAEDAFARLGTRPGTVICTATEGVARDLVRSGAAAAFLHRAGPISGSDPDGAIALPGLGGEARFRFIHPAVESPAPLLAALLSAVRESWDPEQTATAPHGPTHRVS